MFNLDNVNMNDIITKEEAEQILAMAKRIYPGIIDDLFVKYDTEGYAYCRNAATGRRYIQIYPECIDELPEIGERILTHINEEFNSDFAMNLKTITINAFCHEIGHAIDFEMQKMLGNDDYEDRTNEEYAYFHYRAHEYYNELDELEEYMFEYGIDADQELIENWKEELEEWKSDLDYDYRMITTEYAADKFSAEFMNTYLRHVPQLFETERVMTVEN